MVKSAVSAPEPSFDSLLSTAPIAALRVTDGTISYSNPAAVELLIAPTGITGEPLERYLPIATPYARTEFAAVLSRLDRTRLPVRVRVCPVADGDVVWITPLAPQDNDRSFFELASRAASDILFSHTGVEALASFAEAARRLVNARYAAIGVASADGESLDEFITVGLDDVQEKAIGSRPAGAGILGLLLRRDRPLRISRLGDHPLSSGFPPNHPPMDAFLGVPIRHNGNVLGSLYLTDKTDGFTQEDEITVDALSIHLAVAIRNLRLLKRQRALVAGLISAQEEERRAVAYDLHDGLTQYVMGAYAHLQSFRATEASGDAAGAAEEYQIGLRYLNEAVVESRRLVNGLRTLALDDMGLAGALEQLAFEERARAGWTSATVDHQLDEERFNQTVQTAIYRIGQEALTNIRKHASAKNVRLSLAVEPGDTLDCLVLSVEDDGVGFERSAVERHGNRVGLHGMSERARLLEGAFDIDSAPGNGTRVRARIPLFPITNSHEESSHV